MIQQKLQSSTKKSGFTLVEIVIVVVVIGILASIVAISFNSVQSRGRDAQRSTSARIIAETLEKYYTENNEYPGCTNVTDFTNGVLKGLDKSVLITPMSSDKTQPSIKCQDMTNTTTDVYAYLGDGSPTCLTGNYCTSWTLKYKEESTNQIKSIVSRQIASSTVAAPASVVVTATNNGVDNAAGTAAPVTCNLGTPQYAMSSRTNADAWTGYTDWSSTRALVINGTNEGARYSFRAQARCVYQSTQISGTTMSNEADYIRPITAPSAPVLTKSPTATSGTADTVTYSWVAVTCAPGTTVEYSRAWARDDSTGYRAYANSTVTSYAVSTNYQGYEYKAKARALCKSPYATSNWSVESNEPAYVRSVVAPGQATNFRFDSVNYTEYGRNFDRLFVSDPPSCGLGTVREGRWHYFNMSSPNNTAGSGRPIMIKNLNTVDQHIARWKNTSLITAAEIDFTPRQFVDQTRGGITLTSYIDDYQPMGATGIYFETDATNVRGRVVVQYRCINNDTGRAAEGLHVDSGLRAG